MGSRKVSLKKKAVAQAVAPPGNISGSLKVKAELMTKWRLLSLSSRGDRWGLENVLSRGKGNVFS